MRRFFGWAFFLSFLLVFYSCSKPKTDEEVLKAVIMDAASSARGLDIKGVMKHISRDYNDDRGNNYNSVKGILFYEFMRSEKLSVFVRDVKVKVTGERALVDSRVLVVRGKEIKEIKDVIPEDAAGFVFSIIFIKEGKEWKARSVAWSNAGVLSLI